MHVTSDMESTSCHDFEEEDREDPRCAAADLEAEVQ